MNRERVHGTSAHPARLVWLLASLGLSLAVVMVGISGLTASRIDAKRHELDEFQAQTAALMARFDRSLTQGADVFTAPLNGRESKQDGTHWIERMDRLMSETQEVARTFDVVLELTTMRDRCDPSRALYKECMNWHRVNTELQVKIPAAQKEVEDALRKLREALEKTEGRLRLQLAIKTRRLDGTHDPEAGQLAREIVGEMSLPSSLAVAKTELADLALLCERLSREEHIDHLTDLKDNQLKSSLERLQRGLSQIEPTRPEASETPMNLLEAFKTNLFGEGYAFDHAHETILPGEDALFSLTRARLELQAQREALRGEILRHMHELRVAANQINADIYVSATALATSTDQALAQAWRVMLLLCLTTSGIFIFLASRIARAVKAQLVAIEVANKELDNKAHALAEVNTRLQSEINERKRVQRSLEDERDLSESLIDCLPGVFYMIDEQGRIVKHNKAFCQAVDYPSEQIAAMNALDFFDEADRGRVAEAMHKALAEGYAAVEADVASRSGTVAPYYLTGVRVCMAEANYLLGVGIDITERRRAEQKQAHLLNELQQVNEQLKDFAYIVSHDLKAPLRGIKLLTEWLCADYGDQLGDDAQENLDLLGSRVDRMQNLIEGVLQYSRVGSVREEAETVNLNEVLRDIIDAIAPPDHIEITIEGTLPTVRCEKTRIHQVFQNLLSNAVKYMDKPAGRIVVACQDDGDVWTFSVRDNGAGIEEPHFEKIFKIFQTLAPRDEYESTGVGLTLVKRIVELYGGRVWVESEVGQGSTFRFTCPKQKRRAEDRHAPVGAGVIQ